mgnify:CR=1 FL=1
MKVNQEFVRERVKKQLKQLEPQHNKIIRQQTKQHKRLKFQQHENPKTLSATNIQRFKSHKHKQVNKESQT